MFDIPIIMFHSVNNKPKLNPMGRLSVTSKEFYSYMKMFKNMNYDLVSLDEFVNKKVKSNKYAILTFDDGFIDNIRNALPIMKKFNAKGTVFVNPEYIPKIINNKSEWGFMSFDDMRTAEYSKVLDIQSHTINHNFIFKSHRIIDFYSRAKYEKYYWLSWMLFPESIKTWGDDAYKYREMIPEGYPIFEYGRRLASKRFIPDQSYVSDIIKMYRNCKSKSEIIRSINNTNAYKGDYESDIEYENHIQVSVSMSKKILEEELDKTIHSICFPGGAYTTDVIDATREAGYKCYMNSSKLRTGNNFDHFDKLTKGNLVGMNRLSFNNSINTILPAYSAYWISKITLLDYQDLFVAKTIKKILRRKK